ncbi:hypothetical protein HDU76_006006 [Blyttiomyces sp. JEL0837]|nr:hypothetical protein HDU76_006006 [Blyttiomyces sp. JEL0837]
MTSHNDHNTPWIEKYRPSTMAEVSYQDETVSVLRKTIESNNVLPHMLFYGPPGTGKTSTILALAKDLFGHEHYKSRVLELNASDERGIDIVREKVKNFAKTTVASSSGKSLPPYKIIILDEADSMTTDAQSALRRTMETYSKFTRFCLICNYVSRIIDPLASRCAKFRFKPLDFASMKQRLQEIARKEGVQCPEMTIDALIETSEGDLRRAIMYMQSSYRLYQSESIPADVIYEIAGVVPENVMDSLFSAWVSRKFDVIQSTLASAVKAGFSANQIMNQLHSKVIADVTLTSRQKALACRQFGSMDKALIDGADEHLQLLNLLVSSF